MAESRIKKSLLNARVNLIFYTLTLTLTFFSRKIFLNYLGADFIGLTGTLQNILGFLNLAELGIGSAVSFALYKPLQEKNKLKIEEIISLFGYFYRKIGIIIIVIAILVSAFLPLIFEKSDIGNGIIYFAFYAFLTSSLIGYFVNYRSLLLNADQKNYVVATYFQTGNIIKTIIQLTLVYFYKNYYIWISIELVFGIIYSFILNWKIDKTYPWLRSRINQGFKLQKQYPNILQRARQVVVHRFKDFILTQSDQFFIFAFVSLSMVAYYGNYIMVISKISGLFTTTLNSIWAGVGNLVAEGNKKKIMKVFWEMITMHYFIAGIVVFSVLGFIDEFIKLWLGSQYILENKVLYLLVICTWINLTRGVVDMFNGTHGLYGDTWSAWVEGTINLSISIIGGIYYGLPGLLVGKITSLLPIVVLWKPYYLFTRGLKIPYLTYWKGISIYISVVTIPMVILLYTLSIFRQKWEINDSGWGNLMLSASLFCTLYALIVGSLLLLLTEGGRALFQRQKEFFKH